MEINLSSRDLRAFLAVATTLSFSKAAKEMHLSQSALSTLVVRLETATQRRKEYVDAVEARLREGPTEPVAPASTVAL